MIKGMATLLGFQLTGELAACLGHLPISGPICGMAILLVWLHLKGEVESDLGKRSALQRSYRRGRTRGGFKAGTVHQVQVL